MYKYEKLYIMRKEHRLKQKDVAKKIGVHPQTYHEKEVGKRDFTVAEARLLARFFGCTLNDLFEDDKYIVDKSEESNYYIQPDESLEKVIKHLEKALVILKERNN